LPLTVTEELSAVVCGSSMGKFNRSLCYKRQGNTAKKDVSAISRPVPLITGRTPLTGQ